MTLRKCPECGQSIKLENLRKHYGNVHPGKDPSAAISEQEHRQVRKSARKRSPAFYTRRPFQAGLAVIVLVVAAYVGLAYVYKPVPTSYNVVTDCGEEGQVTHYHPLLVINYNGNQQIVPAEIGVSNTPDLTNPAYYCTNGGIHGMHTHDRSGIIHLELPHVLPTPPTLGDFFTMWGKPLNSGAVWQFSGTVHADVWNADARTVTDYSSAPGSIPLYTPAGGPTANIHPIPQEWIFYGANGDGKSGGYYGGELIWLNVTG